MGLMNRKFEEASARLKEKLASYGIQILNLKKQLSTRDWAEANTNLCNLSPSQLR